MSENVIKVLKSAFAAAVCEEFGFNEQFDASVEDVKKALKEFNIEANCFDGIVSCNYYAKEFREENKDIEPTSDVVRQWFKKNCWYDLNDVEVNALINKIKEK